MRCRHALSRRRSALTGVQYPNRTIWSSHCRPLLMYIYKCCNVLIRKYQACSVCGCFTQQPDFKYRLGNCTLFLCKSAALAMIVTNINSTIIHPSTPVCNSQFCNSTICHHTETCDGVKLADCVMSSRHFRVKRLNLIVIKSHREVRRASRK